MLELGSGPKKGQSPWTTVDLSPKCDICWDLTRGLPFPDDSVEVIYSSHFLEHVRYSDLVHLLEECRRALKAGGLFSACVPDARLYLSAYFNGGEVDLGYEPARCGSSRIDLVNYIAYMDGHHHYLFDEENLRAVLVDRGYHDVRLRAFDEDLDMPEHRDYSLYVEAFK